MALEAPVTARERVRSAVERTAVVVALIVLAPLFCLIALAIVIEDGGPILFRQQRAGRHGAPFTILKFRTMVVDADQYLDESGRPTRRRTTRVGSTLRRLSLDELPQLVNIFRREMTFVGPRPVPIEYYSAMDARQRRRFEVLPGLTGLAQVRGRHSEPWTARLEHDIEYVESRSLLLDAKIIALTVREVLRPSTNSDRNPDRLDLDIG